MNMDELEPECSEECTCNKRQVWKNAKYVLSRYKEELDTQMEYIEWLEQFAPKAGEYNTSWDAYELAMGIQEDEEE